MRWLSLVVLMLSSTTCFLLLLLLRTTLVTLVFRSREGILRPRVLCQAGWSCWGKSEPPHASLSLVDV